MIYKDLNSIDFIFITYSLCIDAMRIISKSWLMGFTEAEGSFYIVLKGKEQLVHAFELTHKKDRIVLEGIAKILHMQR